jgi:dihydrofolate reductase
MSDSAGKRVVLVAAVADNGVIGNGGELPWRIPEDLRHFRATTTGHTVLMGRRTYESIGKPLPDRANVVVTRQPDWSADGVLVAHSIEEAFAKAGSLEGNVMVIGGAEVYAATIAAADEQVLTEVRGTPEGDAHYPDFDSDAWDETAREDHDGYAFVRYARRRRPRTSAPRTR